MDWQNLVALSVVGLSIAYVIHRILRPERNVTPGCASCPAGWRDQSLIPVEEIRMPDDRA